MKNLQVNLKVLIVILFFIISFSSCNNEELFILEETALVVEEPEDPGSNEDTDETPSGETENAPQIEANDDNVTTNENIPIELLLYTNDVNIPESITITHTNPNSGTLSLSDNNTPADFSDDVISYTPDTGFFGTDSFEYTICDAVNASNCSSAIVTITVNENQDEFSTELKAFPSAYGGGGYVTGGRGGTVYHVTNLNNSGPGSYRDAVSSSNRIVVFDVSGTIELTSSLSIGTDNITIAGQTAPQGGITITGQRMTHSNADNWIIRYITVRPDYSSNDAWGFINCDNVIIDHCSTSWGGDEILTFRGTVNDVTIQRTLIGEGKTGSIFGDSDDASINTNLSFLNNAYYNVTHRHPNLNSNSRADVINNIIFNWKYRLSRVSGNIQLNHIGNYYSLGCLSNINDIGMMINISSASPSIFTDNNRVTNGILTSDDTDNWLIMQDWTGGYGAVPTSYQSNTKFSDIGAPYTAKNGQEAFEDVTENCGANTYLDSNGNKNKEIGTIDNIFLTNIKAGNCISYSSSSKGQNYNTFQHYIDFHNSVSSTPINTRPSNFDTDRDGMPDIWETARGLDPSTDDSTGDEDGDGYTNLEEYLNAVDN